MTDSGQAPSTGPSVCPFVALAEDRDRRADAPDEGNRCYAEPAPRQRDMVYQADYCYSTQFSSCSVFLAWAARNAAEPAYVSEAARKAWGSGIAVPEERAEAASGHTGEPTPGAAALPTPTPEGGLFGPADQDEAAEAKTAEQLDWVSASAWAEVPWDERAEQEADEFEELVDAPPEEEPEQDCEEPREEDTTAPKVPAAVPIRRRRKAQPVIRSRGSGEWVYADPPGHEPLVTRRHGVTPAIMLGVLGLLVAALVIFLIPTVFFGGGGEEQTAAAASPSPDLSTRPSVTLPPVTATATPSTVPSPRPAPKQRFYRVKVGDSLTGIAAKFGVKPQHLQCLNNIRNKNIVVLGARYEIPPEGYSCPPGWRNATPEP